MRFKRRSSLPFDYKSKKGRLLTALTVLSGGGQGRNYALIFLGLQSLPFFFTTAPHFLHSYRPGFFSTLLFPFLHDIAYLQTPTRGIFSLNRLAVNSIHQRILR